MENAVFPVGTAENPYSSLPKYGAQENTMMFEDDQDELASHLSVHTDESIGFASALAGSSQPLHMKDKTDKKNSRSSRDSSARGYYSSKTIEVPEIFSDEIRPPSLFSPDIPPAPSEMHGPIKQGERLVSSPSVFIASRQNGGPTNTPPAQATRMVPSQSPQFGVPPQSTVIMAPLPEMATNQAPQYIVPVNTAPQGVYVPQPNHITGYKVPGSIATSMRGRDTSRPLTKVAKNPKVQNKSNQKCWKGCLFGSIFLVVFFIVGAAVAAVVLKQV